MKRIILVAFLALLSSCQSKESSIPSKDNDSVEIKSASDFYPKERAKVLVVGTFHFNYPGLDELKTEESDKIDVLKEPKKSEVTELVEYIKKFKPTKIAIEAHAAESWNKRFKAYKNGEFRDRRDERYQLAMRIGSDFGLDTLYTIDAGSLSNDIFKKDSTFLNTLVDKVDWELEDPYWEDAEKFFDYREKLKKTTPLLDMFKHMNSREGHNDNFGLYLTGSFASGEGQGADYFSMWWYNRNARIFSKIINITESPEDRILVIFGNGHAAILRQFLEASPQYNYIEFDSL